MKFLFLLLLSLKVLKALAFFNYPHNGEVPASNEVEVVDYDKMGQGTCPKIKQPLCATNGEEVLYFDNKCLLEVRNFEQLMKGLKEYFECPLNYCSPQCAPCGPQYEPVCAVDISTGELEHFHNPCEVQRKICFTQREHRIISSGQCPSNHFPTSQCPQICTSEYKPVCGQFQTELRQFPNQCQLDREKCETNKDWQIVDPTYCVSITHNTVSSPFKSLTHDADCPEFCTLEYQPICARFMSLEKEFSNECELKTTICQTKQRWNIIRRGPCQETKGNMDLDLIKPKNKCPEFCTLEYNPICAKFGNELREFANKCELETTICQNREDWQIIEQGPCPTSSNNKAFKLFQKPKCPQFCTLEYRPICAQFEQKVREFGNKCSLESIKCETGQDWQIINNGPCSSSPTELNTKTFILSPKPECPQLCTLEYRPICAQFNNELREFSNKCDLESTICQTNQNWEVVHQGTCHMDQLSQKPKCPEICTLEYRPICAQFNNELREFSNNCHLQRTICETNQDWKIINEGTCFSDSSAEVTECPQFCTKEYRPVCAEFKGEEREFSNKCMLLKAICETNKEWELVKLGPCSKPAPSLFKISPPKCPKFCTREFNPVCAKRNNKFREFSNKCVMETWNCESEEKWELVKMGRCPSIKPASKASALSSSATECPKFCTREFDPVCAKRNNKLREFSNKCVLDTWNCESEEKWELVNLGPCPLIKPASIKPALLTTITECPKFCTREFDPVCAERNNELREFSNICVMETLNCDLDEKWELVNLGPCDKPALLSSQKECPKFCTREYKPICAKFDEELREFPNKCELLRTNCETDKDWEIVNFGTCPSNSRSSPTSLASSANFAKKLTVTALVSCPKACTREYNPVCAKSDQELREFPNRCELQRENCESSKPWVFVNSGPCSSNSDENLKSTPLVSCPKACTREYNPVCAKSNQELREFPNRCELQRENCESNKPWIFVNSGPCSSNSDEKLKPTPLISCPKACSREFDPVCAQSDQELREFPNRCELLRENCESSKPWIFVKSGSCSSNTDNKLKPTPLVSCPKACTREYNPVCAQSDQELREFPNRCELLRENCESSKPWIFVKSGPCSSNTDNKLKPTPLVSCPKACTREYSPVCAKSDQELREFPNRCELQRENCESSKPWIFVNSGPCSSNSAEKLTLAPLKLKVKQDEPLTPPCNPFCTDDLRPVCAEFNSELREFPNRCEMQITICETKNKWKVINEGPCPAKSELKPACPKFCTREFRPVCARFKGDLREFPNKCEFQRSVCETNIAWELINNGPCLIKNFETDNIELQPICATDGKVKQMFDDPSELQEEIRKTGIAWSLLHNDECLPPTPVAKFANKAFALASDKTTQKSTTFTTTASTTPKTTSSTTFQTSAKPKTTTTPKTSTTQKTTTTLKTSTTSPKTTAANKSSTTPKASTTTKPKTTTGAKFLTSAKTSTTLKPQHTTTTKTITATTTTPRTTTSSTTMKPTTPRTSTSQHPRYSPTTSSTTNEHHLYSYEYSTENDSAEIDDSNEDFVAFSEENEDDEDSISWEDDEEENGDEELEEDEDDISKSFEVGSSYIFDDNTYTYKHNESNSTYTFVYGKYSNIPENGKDRSDGKNFATMQNSKKESKLAEPKVNQGISSNNSSKSGHITEKNDSTNNSKLGNLKSSGQNKGINAGTFNNKPNQDDLGLFGNSDGENIIKSIQERLQEESGQNKGKKAGTFNNKSKQVDFSLFGNSEGENIIKSIQERLQEEFGGEKSDDLSKGTQGNDKVPNHKQRDKIKPKLGKGKLNFNTKNQQQIKAISGQANANLNTEERVRILANPEQPNPNLNADFYIHENGKGIEESVQEDYGNLGQSNLNLNTEKQVQIIANPGQSNLNSDAALYIPEHNEDFEGNVEEIYGNLLHNTNQEQSKMDSPSVLYNPEYYEGPKDIMQDNYEDLLTNFHDSDESQEDNISSEEDTAQANSQGMIHSLGIPSLNENEPKFGVYSDEAYGLMDSGEVSKDDEWSRRNQAKESQYSNANNNNYQDDENTEPNEQLPEYSSQSPTNSSHNTENILEVFEALLSESDAEEEDDETLVKQVLTTLGSETTTAYPSYEDMENHSNYTKREEYPYKYNHTKKGEIYNGAVYKAPVYDAPTYNFIYTAPNHPVMPLMPGNHHPYLQYPGFMPQYADPTANPYNPFVALRNQSNLGAAVEAGPGTNSPFNPMQFLTSLAAMSGPFGSAMPNPMPLPQLAEYNSNLQPETHTNPLDLQENPSQLPLNPSSPGVYNQILPQTHPSPHMFLPPLPEPFLNSFSPLTNIASQIPNSLPLKEKREYDNNQPTTEIEENLDNGPNADGSEAELSRYPHPIYNNPVNPQMQQPLPLFPPMSPNALPNPNFQNLPYHQPPTPLYYPPLNGPLPLNVFNATLIQQIADTLKTITSRY